MLTDEQREAWANHGIIGTRKGKQGAGQIVPEDLILCWSCGWMRVSEYHEHLALLIEQWISEAVDAAVRDALESGELPDGWGRDEQWRHSTPWSHDQSPQDRRSLAELHKPRDAVIQHRIAITDPWREVGDDDAE